MKTIKEIAIGAICALIIMVAFVFGGKYQSGYTEVEPTVIESVTPVTNCTELEAYNPIELNKDIIAADSDTDLIFDIFRPLDIPLDEEVQEYLRSKCEENYIDFAFALALIETESNFDARAWSKTNDFGLFQINKCNTIWLSEKTGARDYLNPYDNIDAGLYMLHDLFAKFEEGELVLMVYHFGYGGAKKLWDKGIYTSKYSEHILKRQLEYQAMIEDNA